MFSKNTICLWYDGTALDAAKFYAETFPDSAVGAVHLAPGDYPAGKQGDVLTTGGPSQTLARSGTHLSICRPQEAQASVADKSISILLLSLQPALQ